jgi:hypothetical protein
LSGADRWIPRDPGEVWTKRGPDLASAPIHPMREAEWDQALV